MNIYSKHRKSAEDCPLCHPNCDQPSDPYRGSSRCVLNKPLMMVIPPGGAHLDCPVHPEGHHISGPQVAWSERLGCEFQHDSSQDLTYDSTHPFGTATGSSIGHTWKLSM